MEQSSLLMSAHIHFVDAQLSLIHIPLNEYQAFLPAILQLLFPTSSSKLPGGHADDATLWANQFPFLNVSVTPIEASVVCPKVLAEALFLPRITKDEGVSVSKVERKCPVASVSSEDYVVISVEGGGSEAGQRVLEITGPLALAGISLFFITTYFSDYILVPSKAKGTVVRALEERGFAFEKSSESYVNAHHRAASSTSSLGVAGSPGTPPPTTISELQARTFALLSRRSIVPRVDRNLQLIQCTGRRGNPQSAEADELGLRLGLTDCLIHQPSFLSLTLTEDEAASILMEKQLLANFNVGSDNVLLGSKDEILIPITLDLEPLPFEATGIVCGVAGRLVGGHNSVQTIEMSYLSTAKAGTVMVQEGDLDQAMRALRVGEDGTIQP